MFLLKNIGRNVSLQYPQLLNPHLVSRSPWLCWSLADILRENCCHSDKVHSEKNTLGPNIISTFSHPISTVGICQVGLHTLSLWVKPVEPRLHLFLYSENSCFFIFSKNQGEFSRCLSPLNEPGLGDATIRRFDDSTIVSLRPAALLQAEASGRACGLLGLFQAGTPRRERNLTQFWILLDSFDFFWLYLEARNSKRSSELQDLQNPSSVRKTWNDMKLLILFQSFNVQSRGVLKLSSRAKLQVEVHFGEFPPCSQLGNPASVSPEDPLCVRPVPAVWNLAVSTTEFTKPKNPFDHGSFWLLSDIVISSAMA